MRIIPHLKLTKIFNPYVEGVKPNIEAKLKKKKSVHIRPYFRGEGILNM